MPLFDDMMRDGNFKARIFLYGPAKTRKTWWSLKAVEAGLNVISLDGDGEGFQIAKLIDPNARRNLAILDIKSRQNQPVMAGFMRKALKFEEFIWDETDKKFVIAPHAMDLTHSHALINFKKLTPNDVLVVDSWTALVDSIRMQNAKDQQIDLSGGQELKEAKDSGQSRDLYFMDGSVANWTLDQLNSLNCHLIVIGHAQVYEKYKREGKKDVLQWSRTQPISTSGAHSGKLAKYFADVLFFHQIGIDIRISAEPKADRDGGGRNIPPQQFTFSDGPTRLQFVDYFKLLGVPQRSIAGYSSEAVKFYKVGDQIEISKPSSIRPTGLVQSKSQGSGLSINTAGTAAAVKPSPLASLMKK